MRTSLRLSPDQLVSLTKCAVDPVYFGNNYCWLEREASAEVLPFKVLEFQEKLLNNFVEMKKTVVNKSRRVGWSWAIALFSAWCINFVPGVKILILSRTEDDAKIVLNKVKFILQNLREHTSDNFMDAEPALWLKGEIVTNNSSTLTRAWRNPDGSIRETSSVVSLTNNDQSGRGQGARYLFMDEFAFYLHDWLVWRSISKTVIGGGMWAVGSSPNSIGNKFHQLVSQAKLGKNVDEDGNQRYEFLEVHWSDSWLTKEEVEADKATSTSEDARQEWELEFLTPGNSVFDSAKLAVCFKDPEEYPEVKAALEKYHEKVLAGKEGSIYYSGADTMIGKIDRRSNEKDYHAFVAFTEHGIVAKAYSSQESLAKWAGENVTLEGKRFESEGTLSKLHKNYPGILRIEEQGGGVTAHNNHILPVDGMSDIELVHQNEAYKTKNINLFKIAIEKESVIITDHELYQQLLIYQDNGPGKRRFSAPAGYNDDLVDACIHAYGLLAREGMVSITWSSELSKLERESESGNMTSLDNSDEVYGPAMTTENGQYSEYNPLQWRRQSDELDLGSYRPPRIEDYIHPVDIPEEII